MLTGQGHPPQKYALQRSSLDEEIPHHYNSFGRSNSITDHHPFRYHYPSPPQSPLTTTESIHSHSHNSFYHPSSPRKMSLSSQDDHVTPDMEGWLYKQGDKYKTWNKRWFVLKGSNLFYFKSPKVKQQIHAWRSTGSADHFDIGCPNERHH